MIEYLEVLLPLFLHFCKSHVYRALRDWLNEAKRPQQVKDVKDRLLSMFKYMAKDITEEASMSKSIAKLCKFIAILSTPDIPFKLDVSTPTMEHKNEAEFLSIAEAQEQLVEDVAEGLQIKDYEELKAGIEKAMEKNFAPSTHEFNGKDIAKDALQRLREEQVFYYVYPF